MDSEFLSDDNICKTENLEEKESLFSCVNSFSEIKGNEITENMQHLELPQNTENVDASGNEESMKNIQEVKNVECIHNINNNAFIDSVQYNENIENIKNDENIKIIKSTEDTLNTKDALKHLPNKHDKKKKGNTKNYILKANHYTQVNQQDLLLHILKKSALNSEKRGHKKNKLCHVTANLSDNGSVKDPTDSFISPYDIYNTIKYKNISEYTDQNKLSYFYEDNNCINYNRNIKSDVKKQHLLVKKNFAQISKNGPITKKKYHLKSRGHMRKVDKHGKKKNVISREHSTDGDEKEIANILHVDCKNVSKKFILGCCNNINGVHLNIHCSDFTELSDIFDERSLNTIKNPKFCFYKGNTTVEEHRRKYHTNLQLFNTSYTSKNRSDTGKQVSYSKDICQEQKNKKKKKKKNFNAKMQNYGNGEMNGQANEKIPKLRKPQMNPLIKDEEQGNIQNIKKKEVDDVTVIIPNLEECDDDKKDKSDAISKRTEKGHYEHSLKEEQKEYSERHNIFDKIEKRSEEKLEKRESNEYPKNKKEPSEPSKLTDNPDKTESTKEIKSEFGSSAFPSLSAASDKTSGNANGVDVDDDLFINEDINIDVNLAIDDSSENNENENIEEDIKIPIDLEEEFLCSEENADEEEEEKKNNRVENIENADDFTVKEELLENLSNIDDNLEKEIFGSNEKKKKKENKKKKKN